MGSDGHVDHERVVELKMQEMSNEVDADGNGANDLPEYLPSTVEKVKDTDTKEELVKAIQVIDQDENKATIKKLIVNSGTSFEDVHESLKASRGDSSSVGFLSKSRHIERDPCLSHMPKSSGHGASVVIKICCSATDTFKLR